jgi:hypothetical protein
MQTFPVRCNKCKNVFTVPGDLASDDSGAYNCCPNCKEQNSWETISWEEYKK